MNMDNLLVTDHARNGTVAPLTVITQVTLTP